MDCNINIFIDYFLSINSSLRYIPSRESLLLLLFLSLFPYNPAIKHEP